MLPQGVTEQFAARRDRPTGGCCEWRGTPGPTGAGGAGV